MKGESFLALIAGAASGFALGLLFAPEKGEVTRRKVKDVADEYASLAQDKFDEATDAVEDSAAELKARARLARRDLKDLRGTLEDQASDLKEDARKKILDQLEKLERSLKHETEEENL